MKKTKNKLSNKKKRFTPVNQKKKYLIKEDNLGKASSTVKKDFYLSDTDRITYCYEHLSKSGQVVKVVNVSYEVNIQEEWITVVRFDSDHGYLHRHTRISLNNRATIVDQNGLVIRGTAKHWLSWSIRHLTKGYDIYKKKFLKISKLPNE